MERTLKEVPLGQYWRDLLLQLASLSLKTICAVFTGKDRAARNSKS